jgi:hypothetical protein
LRGEAIGKRFFDIVVLKMADAASGHFAKKEKEETKSR